MTKFWELLEQSTIVTGILAVMFSAAILLMFVRGMAVPEVLVNMEFVILAFFFGAKSQKGAVKHG